MPCIGRHPRCLRVGDAKKILARATYRRISAALRWYPSAVVSGAGSGTLAWDRSGWFVASTEDRDESAGPVTLSSGRGMSAGWSQPELVAANGRRFAGFAAAVVVFIIDPSTRRFLLVSSPAKRGREGWESVSGGLEGGESLMVGLRREVAEEVGPAVRLRVLGTVHASTPPPREGRTRHAPASRCRG